MPTKPPDLRPYAGRWVALVADQVVSSGRTPAETLQRALHSRRQERPLVGYVQPGLEPRLLTRLPLTALLETVGPLILSLVEHQGAAAIYLVGGAVRDALTGRVSHDLDFVVAGDAVGLARAVADGLGGGFFLMDPDRGTARVILPEAVLDFACLRGKTLLDDLKARDFTVNAMALPVGSTDAQAIIDPLGGQNDLAAGDLQATGPNAILQDPVRGLRAVRLAAEQGLRILSNTQALIRSASDQLVRVSAERVRDELARLLIASGSAGSVRQLDELGLLVHVLPELILTRGVAQPPPHTLDVYDHTLLTLERLVLLQATILEAEPPAQENLAEPLALARQRLRPYAPDLARHLARPTSGDRDGRFLLALGALLHDVGKPASQSVDADGRVRFLGHEQIGASMAQQRARELALSSDEARQVGIIVRHHMRPALLAKTDGPEGPSRRAIYRFFRDTGQNGLDVCLLCLADGLGKDGQSAPADWAGRVETVRCLLEHYVDRHAETIAPPPLLSGRELMAHLDLQPGPEVGRLLQLIQEAQAAGELETAGDALALARKARQQEGS